MSTKTENKILTVPNLLTCVRLALIPFLIKSYCVEKNYPKTILLMILSGFTDIADGFIARKFHMVSNLGKALDPIADKLTQGVMLFCLMTRFPYILILFCLLILKEIMVGISQLLVIRKTGKVYGADWHGKLTTVCVYSVIVLHLFWYEIPEEISYFTVGVCFMVMIMSLALYIRGNYKKLKAS